MYIYIYIMIIQNSCGNASQLSERTRARLHGTKKGTDGQPRVRYVGTSTTK